jgi:hypothetical protein
VYRNSQKYQIILSHIQWPSSVVKLNFYYWWVSFYYWWWSLYVWQNYLVFLWISIHCLLKRILSFYFIENGYKSLDILTTYTVIVISRKTIAVYMVEVSRVWYLFSLSNKWTYPHLSFYFFVIERQCGLGKKYLI